MIGNPRVFAGDWGSVSILLITVATYGLFAFQKLGFIIVKQRQSTVHSIIFVQNACSYYGPGSSIGIATGYGLDGPGSNPSGGGEIFHTCRDRPWGPPSLLYNGYRVFSGGKERLGGAKGVGRPRWCAPC
jgi:hypothetical protein